MEHHVTFMNALLYEHDSSRDSLSRDSGCLMTGVELVLFSGSGES